MSSTTPDSPVGFPQVAAALAAVDVELRAAAAEATWVIVAGHYPVRSAAEHGDTLQLARLLLPLLRGRGVDAYACGHDHTLQALEDTPTGLRFVVSGNGAEPGGNPNRETSSRRIGFPHAGAKVTGALQEYPGLIDHPDSDTNLAFSSLENGFAVHVVGPESMFTELRGRGGSSLYSMEQAPRAKCAAADVADCPFYDVPVVVYRRGGGDDDGGAWAVGAAAASVLAVAAAASCGCSAMMGYAAGRKRSEPPSPGAHPQTQLV
jgi:hypothetical protein